jgi:deazaflavin-dependent oxidoreductase (nitroreductase family)
VTRTKDAAFRAGTAAHRALLRLSRGRAFGRVAGMPVIVLSTTGRRTGRTRSTVLTAPVTDGGRLVLVASYGGDHRHPAWFLNVRANPDVTVTTGGRCTPMHARVATAAERADLWPRVVAAYPGYATYQARTPRTIPLVIVEPRHGG